MTSSNRQSGFSLVELLVAATIFTFVVMGVSSLFAQALDLQRRATGLQKIQENALYVMESIAREVRVSSITSLNTNCNPPDAGTRTMTIKHPVNGDVTYTFGTATGVGAISRSANGEPDQVITSSDVDFKSFAFCVSGVGVDGKQSRVTIPMTIQAVSARASGRVTTSLQTTIVSRDLSEELNK